MTISSSWTRREHPIAMLIGRVSHEGFVLEAATKTTSEKVKRQLASEIAAFLTGELGGRQGGATRPRPRPQRDPSTTPPPVDDSLMLQVPDSLVLVGSGLSVRPGATTALHVEINAKNDFLPRHKDGLSIVFGPELTPYVTVRSKGRLLGGRVRVTLAADAEAPAGVSSSLRVALVVPELGVLLTADGTIEITAEEPRKTASDPRRGGEPDIDVQWIGRAKWSEFEPPWDAETVGVCMVHRDGDGDAITRVDWYLNEDFSPYSQVAAGKSMGEEGIRRFRESYEYPVLFGLFKQRLAEEAKENEADEQDVAFEIPDDYVRGEQARMARAVLMALEPEIKLVEAVETAG